MLLHHINQHLQKYGSNNCKKVKDGKGVIGINLNLDNILKISKMINIGEKGYAVILDQNKQIVSHPSRKPGAKVTDP